MGVVCEIILNEAKEGVFRSGQTVSGTVKYSIAEPKKFGSIHLYLEGNGKCEWSEKDSDDNTTYYKNAEEYTKQYRNMYIVREEKNELSGKFEFPFEFVLPEKIPSTIKNLYCTIEYKLIVTFVKENLYETEYQFEEEVPVYGYVDPCSPEPMIFGLEKNLFSLTTKKCINVAAEIEKTCLTAGENIALKLTVNNDTDIPISIKTELVKYLTYIDKGNVCKKIEREQVKPTKSYSPSLKEKNVSKIACIVPTLSNCYSIQYSKILVGEYKVKVTVKVPFPHINASVEVPVVIGARRPNQGQPSPSKDIKDDSPTKHSPEEEKHKEKENKGEINFFDLHNQLKELQFS